MTLFREESPPSEDVWISLDLETTGLSPKTDDIIEVGAIKFRGDETIDTFQSLVNPKRQLDSFIVRYTGISQKDVDNAPQFSVVARDLAPFIGSTPIVGHNIAFDLAFLANKGIKLSNPQSDTWDLGFVLMPDARSYSLGKLAALLKIPNPQPHRAIEDARVTKDLFLKFMTMAQDMDPGTLAEIEKIGSLSSWVLSYLIKRMVRSNGITASNMLINSLDTKSTKSRLKHTPILAASHPIRKVDINKITSLLSSEDGLGKAIPGFEKRSQQIAMGQAITNAINEEKSLLVEAGTGVGKSLAYLIPAAMYAILNNKRVVISTNTINLQEQLATKDLPAAINALTQTEDMTSDDFLFTMLKGRANYLCLKRWQQLRANDSLSKDEARMLSKILVWLKKTSTGDRNELNLGNGETAAPWERISAQQSSPDCHGVDGLCFLRAARDRSAGAHIVIVNHALLMSNLTSGNSLLPDHDVLIIDEAHHIEDEATKQLGFELGQGSIDDHLQNINGERGLLNKTVTAFLGTAVATSRREGVEQVAQKITLILPELRNQMATMFDTIIRIVNDIGRPENGLPSPEKRVTAGLRSQPEWSQLEIEWENTNLLLTQLGKHLGELSVGLSNLDNTNLVDYEELLAEVAATIQKNSLLQKQLQQFIPNPEPDQIYWTSQHRRTGSPILHCAPLNVGEQLETNLFRQKKTVILTGATLSTNQHFDHIKGRINVTEAEELLLGSPFDYDKAALLCIPKDMPEPSSWAYQPALEQAITDATVAANGRTMTLFTSHSALQATAKAIRGTLQSRGFNLLAQGIDGNPNQIARNFLDNPRSVLLGTASFWEGVDLPGDALKVLIVAKLPFDVPTDPIFEARSELYEDAFYNFAIPRAVIRVRQGFGRLIRTKTDTGVVAILDHRVLSRQYGKEFLASLPPVNIETHKLLELGVKIQDWLFLPEK